MDKKSKLMLCKHCGQEIAVGAKSCPKCGGKNNKPIYKKWWFWAIILMIAIAAAGGSGSPDADDVSGTDASVSEGQENPVENDKSEEEPKVPTEYKTALKKAKQYSDTMHLSKRGIYDQLTSEYGEKFTEEEARYAVENLA